MKLWNEALLAVVCPACAAAPGGRCVTFRPGAVRAEAEYPHSARQSALRHERRSKWREDDVLQRPCTAAAEGWTT